MVVVIENIHELPLPDLENILLFKLTNKSENETLFSFKF